MAKPLSALDKIRDTIHAHRNEVKSALRAYLGQMDPYEFEQLIGNLLEKMSFTDCVVTQQYKDGGIDLKANFSIGISEIKTLGQVKRIKKTVGTQDLQQFYGAMTALMVKNEVHLGLYITTSSFASGAVKWVEESSLPLVLVDGGKLVDLLVEHGLLVRQVDLPCALEPVFGDALCEASGPVAASVENASADLSVSQRKTAFKWTLDITEAGVFTLGITYQPDPSKSFSVRGVRVPPGEDFKPARARLQQEIVSLIAPLFPGLDKNLIRAKAWSGTHRVYPAAIYGR